MDLQSSGNCLVHRPNFLESSPNSASAGSQLWTLCQRGSCASPRCVSCPHASPLTWLFCLYFRPCRMNLISLGSFEFPPGELKFLSFFFPSSVIPPLTDTGRDPQA